jgi:WD domain, G-beta repeat
MAASPDDSYTAFARQDEADVLDAAGHRVARLRINGMPDGLSFYDGDAAIMVMTATAIYLWRLWSGRPPLVIPQPSQPTDATVSGGFLAAADGGETVGVWSASTGKLVHSLTPQATPAPPGADYSASPAVPLRVAIPGNGTVVAAGSDDGSISLWDIATGRLIAHDPSEGYVIELTVTPSGDLLAVDWPAIGAHGPFSPVNGEVIAGSTGQVLASYTANNQVQPSISPGAALSPDGGFILAGADGIAPMPPGGLNAAYQVSSGQTMTGLQSAAQPALYSYAESPASPWSPDDTKILIGTAIYACDACGGPAALQTAAVSRLAWSKPLSASADRPPATSPYA